MPHTKCPQCSSPAREMARTSQRGGRTVNYYRCQDCAHVWHVPRARPGRCPDIPATSARTGGRQGASTAGVPYEICWPDRA